MAYFDVFAKFVRSAQTDYTYDDFCGFVRDEQIPTFYEYMEHKIDATAGTFTIPTGTLAGASDVVDYFVIENDAGSDGALFVEAPGIGSNDAPPYENEYTIDPGKILVLSDIVPGEDVTVTALTTGTSPVLRYWVVGRTGGTK